MTDEKDVKESSGDAKDAPAESEPAAPAEAAKPAEAAAAVEAAPAAAAPAAAPEKASGATSSPPPRRASDHPAPLAAKHAAGSSAATGTTPAPGVRVRLTYANGTAIEAPTDAKSRLKPRRLLAEYETTAEVIHAAESLRDAGYKSFESHSPFPIHGMDAAMGLSDSKLGWIVLLCGLTGVSSAWLMMFWMNGVDYPIVIGGKPPGTLPSMVPIMFELTVLLSSFGAVFGMFGLNRLPQHHDVLFYSDRFAAFSNDRFFISVDSTDPKFDFARTSQLLERTRPEAIEVIETTPEVSS